MIVRIRAMRWVLPWAMLAAAGAMAVEVEDNCAMCHDTAPVPDDHAPMEVMSLDACTMCHEPASGDPFFRAVHTGHLEMGLDCSDCHGSNAPPRDRLDQLMGD